MHMDLSVLATSVPQGVRIMATHRTKRKLHCRSTYRRKHGDQPHETLIRRHRQVMYTHPKETEGHRHPIVGVNREEGGSC